MDALHDDIIKVAEVATTEGETNHQAFDMTAGDVADTIYAAGRYAKAYKEKHNT